MNPKIETKELLQTILNSAQEGVQVIDAKGNIQYINKAFTKITKIKPEERIGKNVVDISPEGALSEVLRTKKPVFGKPNIVEGSNVEVISNASPIILNGEFMGAVVVFRDITDMKKLLKKLYEREEIIKTLKGEIKQFTKAKYTINDIIGKSQLLTSNIDIAERAATTDSTVLITGESGTGKELFAHSIHNMSIKKDMPFVKVNCAAIPVNLLESELFGHEKGAFTGADKTKIGKFELANGGSIFLDEIGDMDIILQGKILRVLQEKEIERVGGRKTINVDVRIIAATNRDLEKLIKANKFREDLYYRLNIIKIHVPPLRERREDIPEIIEKNLKKISKKQGKEIKNITEKCRELLQSYSWPGNIRELENILERAVIMSENNIISEDLIKPFLQIDPNQDHEIISLNEMEKRIIKKAIEKYGNSLEGKKKIAKKLKISLATLYNKLKRYGI